MKNIIISIISMLIFITEVVSAIDKKSSNNIDQLKYNELIKSLIKANSLLNQASNYKYKGKYKDAIHKYYEYINLFEKKLKYVKHSDLPDEYVKYRLGNETLNLFIPLNVLWSAYFSTAECYEDLGSFDEAIKVYRKIIKKNIGRKEYAEYRIKFIEENMDYNYEPLKLFIEIERKLKWQYEQQIVKLQKLIKDYPKSTLVDDAYFLMAECFHHGYREYYDIEFPEGINKSLNTYKLIVERYPFSDMADDAQYMRGLLYWILGDWEKAIEEYEKVIKLFSDRTQQILSMAKIHSEQTTRATTASLSQFKIARIYHDKGMYKKAINAYYKCFNNYSINTYTLSALYYIGESYKKIGEFDKSIEVYKKFIAVRPKGWFVWASDWDGVDGNPEDKIKKIEEKHKQNSSR